MKKNISFIVLLFVLNNLYSQITSIKDETFSFKGNEKALIFYNVDDLQLRKGTELFFEELKKSFNFFEPIPSINLISPLRNYNESDLDSILKANNIKYILTINITDSYTKTEVLPGSSHSNYDYTLKGNRVQGTSNTYNSGDITVEKPRLNFRVEIFSIESSNKIWMADIKTKGNAFANNLGLSKALVKKVIYQLKKDYKQ